MITTILTAEAPAHIQLLPRIILWFVLTLVTSVPGQVRPTIMNPGEANETTNQPPRVDRSRVGPTKASRPTLSVLIVLTEPKVAEIRIDGRPAGKSQDGRFTKELVPRKRYKISVSAGPDYLEHEQVVTLKSREPAIVEAPLTPRYGTIRIFPARDGVNLLDNDQPIPAENRTVDSDHRIIIAHITPGAHKITYDLPSYVLYQRSFTVTPGSEFSWNFEPERAVTELSVVTDPGATVYIDSKQVGNTPANGRLAYTAELGPHQITLVKEDFEEYSETRDFKYREPVTVNKSLVPVPTSAEFSDDFDFAKPDLWSMPRSGISFTEGRMQVDSAKTLASPINIRYRDFEMSFLLRLGNAGGAAWAVRVKDENNYYLFYLSGPTGTTPNRFNTYIVRNGEFDPSKHFRSDPLIEHLIAGGQYRIVIKATGNRIEHEITPATTGKAMQLGFFDDPNNTFRLGGIGFRTVGLERFSIDDLFVQPR
jgi:PEGA domain